MKRMMFVMASMLLSSVLFAGNMKIEMDQYSRYEVKIDGKTYTTSKRLAISNLDRGRHSIKIYEINKNRSWGNSGKELLYSGNFNVESKRETLYASYTDQYGLRISDDDRYNNGNYGSGNNDYYSNRDRQREIERQRQIQRQREIQRQRDYDRRRYNQNRTRDRNVCAPSPRRRTTPSRTSTPNRRSTPNY